MTDPSTTGDVTMIDAGELACWQATDLCDLYDVREWHEHQVERIPDATLVPLSGFDPAAVTATPGRHVVFHCKSGVRCGIAAMIMIAAGFDGPIYRLDGGIEAWKAAGGKTVAGDS